MPTTTRSLILTVNRD